MPPPSIVDEDVEAPEPFDRGPDERFRLTALRHVGAHGERGPTVTVDPGGQSFELVLPAGRQDDSGPFARDLHGKSRPDP